MNDFNRIANLYDALARFVFGRNIVESQTHFLSLINEKSDVLIIGGGTGWILEELDKRTKGCKVWYIEQSEKMITLAKSRAVTSNEVHFVHDDKIEILHEKKFDVIITNFFLDVFPDEKTNVFAKQITLGLKESGIWLVTDFVNNTWWQKSTLWVMYRFFAVTASIEARHLPNWQHSIQCHGFKEQRSQFFCHSFIKSAVYRNGNSVQAN